MNFKGINWPTLSSQPILKNPFRFFGQSVELLFDGPRLIILEQMGPIFIITVRPELSFSILEDNQKRPKGLAFHIGDYSIPLETTEQGTAQQWEEILMQYITRKHFHEFFRPASKLGKGQFASVYLAEDLRARRWVAVKAYLKKELGQRGKKMVQNEIRLLRALRHPNIITLHGVYETDNSLYLSMEFQSETNLRTLLNGRHIDLIKRRRLLKGLLEGLKRIREQGVVHRDLKPQNIIVSADCRIVKIIDFGMATYVSEPSYLYIRCGTMGYIAPEIINIRDKDLHQVRMTTASDMFSLGAIYYEITLGIPLFLSHGKTLIYNQAYGSPSFPSIATQTVSLNEAQNTASALGRTWKLRPENKFDLAFEELELIQGMLELEPTARLTPEQALKKPFFLRGKQRKLAGKQLSEKRKIAGSENPLECSI